MSKTDSRASAERIAVERAKQQAIADKFGTIVHQNSRTIVRNENGNSSIDFLSLGGTEVKGEWIEDITPPKTELIMENGELAIKATVKGKIRQIVRAEIDISAKILRNGITSKFESDRFLSGNDLYMLFNSPESGYLNVYLLDEEGSVYCLLPYQSSDEGAKRVIKDRDYLFFHIDIASDSEKRFVDEYVMTTTKSSEINYFYIVFSPNPFTKVNINQPSDENALGSTELEQFERWLSNNRNRDTQMQLMRKSIEIKPQ
ncbi:MAG: DUF4384 domain-containing protein [Rikenellaceae bacterium]